MEFCFTNGKSTVLGPTLVYPDFSIFLISQFFSNNTVIDTYMF